MVMFVIALFFVFTWSKDMDSIINLNKKLEFDFSYLHCFQPETVEQNPIQRIIRILESWVEIFMKSMLDSLDYQILSWEIRRRLYIRYDVG
jgi:hypothetical protein